MILIDTSAWVEFLRDTGSATCSRVDALLDDEIAICDAIRMEVLAGARDERHLQALRRLLALATVLPRNLPTTTMLQLSTAPAAKEGRPFAS